MLKKTLLLSITTLLFTAAGASAQMLITSYGFESSHPTGTAASVTYSPDSGSGSGTAVHASASTVYSDLVGNGSANSLSSNTWTQGDYYQFTAPTLTYTGIYVTFGMLRSGTGPATFSLQYSTDGSTFTTFASVTDGSGNVASSFAVNSTPAFSSTATNYRTADEYTADLSTITALNNQATVTFRLIDTAVTGATGGTARVDDFNISTGGFVLPAAASAVPEPSAYAALAFGGLGMLVMLRSRRRAA